VTAPIDARLTPARAAGRAGRTAQAQIEPADIIEVGRLADMISDRSPITILCGAGCSTASGIPDYRDNSGSWKQKRPMQFAEFMSGTRSRRRYWARSMVGWPRFAAARPNAVHYHLATLERLGHVHTLVTQNVDGLHRTAGQRRVIDLHGRLAQVVCTDCGAVTSRRALQERLARLNPDFHLRIQNGAARFAATAADGDAVLESGYEDFKLADCAGCGGILKPNVVFFGEAVPAHRVERAYTAVGESGLLLVVGSSLMVFSGYRFCRAATAHGIPLSIINRGRTRADGEADLKIEADCAAVLGDIVRRLSS
jgi:NAD-dependent SIR2 family protein deacetylase